MEWAASLDECSPIEHLWNQLPAGRRLAVTRVKSSQCGFERTSPDLVMKVREL